MKFKAGDRVRLVGPHTVAGGGRPADTWLEIGDTGLVVLGIRNQARVAWDRPHPSETDNPADQDLAWADNDCLAYAEPVPVHDLEALEAWLNS